MAEMALIGSVTSFVVNSGVGVSARTGVLTGPRIAALAAVLGDAAITEVRAGYYEADEHGRRQPESLYGTVNMWAHLRREGIPGVATG
jgi:putative transposase